MIMMIDDDDHSIVAIIDCLLIVGCCCLLTVDWLLIVDVFLTDHCVMLIIVGLFNY